MKTKDLERFGVPLGAPAKAAIDAVVEMTRGGASEAEVNAMIKSVVANPEDYAGHAVFGRLSDCIIRHRARVQVDSKRDTVVPYEIFGKGIEEDSVNQLVNACSLPVSVRGALMPDAHTGYGLPIGGVLAVKNAVIPYAVGVDIACRMRLTVLDTPPHAIDDDEARLISVLEKETAFGVGAEFRKNRRLHPVMDEDWRVSKVTQRLKDKAWGQLGTSGSGNHFVEYGILKVTNDALGLARGDYLALLSHSGSRGAGNEVAKYYSRIAMNRHKGLPKHMSQLAWLDMDSHDGKEYWAAMQLMGKYAAANHEIIHERITKSLGARAIIYIENHHNFAWKEIVDGKEVVVHRKGATPAAEGMLGIIPGSMATKGYVVRGKGSPRSMASASHGAGRRMSRTKAKQTFNWTEASALLKKRKVKLISAGLDEVPMAYKDIETVMAAQKDFVDVMAEFIPRIVKMAPGFERPED